MQLHTTMLDGMDLALAPNNVSADPVDFASSGQGLLGRVHFLWPVTARARNLTLSYESLDSHQARRLIAAFGPKTIHNKVVSLNQSGKLYFLPGEVQVNARVQEGDVWRVEVEGISLEFDELGGGVPHQLAELDNKQARIRFAVYRYGHLYVVQEGIAGVSIYIPGVGLNFSALPFIPEHWASYDGKVVLYSTYSGAAAYIGDTQTELYTGIGPWTAPRARIHRAGLPAHDEDGEVAESGTELNGLLYEFWGSTWYFPTIGHTLYTRPLAAQIEDRQTLLLANAREGFSYYNGVQGNLLYADPITTSPVVPYIYDQQGLLAAGTRGGYYFSPDMGISWRFRKLNGFGALAPNALLQVSPDRGVEVAVGRW